MNETPGHAFMNFVAPLAIIGAWLDYMPKVAAALAAVWYLRLLYLSFKHKGKQ